MVRKYLCLRISESCPAVEGRYAAAKGNGHLRANPTALLSRGDGAGTSLTSTGVCLYAEKSGMLFGVGAYADRAKKRT